MARFSVGGDADEGSSSQLRRKRARVESRPVSLFPEPEDTEESSEEEEEVESSSEEEAEENEEEEEEVDVEEQEEEDESVGIPNETLNSGLESSSAPPSSGSNGNRRVFVTLDDPEVLDCPICYDSLTIPVFQCENGHIACTSCCKKISNKCPSCLLPIGYNRCRAIEKVLESVKLPCQNLNYGCREMVIYSKKSDHEKLCSHAPYTCPVSTCKFIGSFKQLYQHVTAKHKGSAVHFQFNKSTPLFFTLTDKSLILQEEKGILFVLNNREESIGNVITVSSFAPPSNKNGYFYEVTAKSERSNLRFQGWTKNIRKLDSGELVLEEYLLVPRRLFGSYGQISLQLSVSENGQLGRACSPLVSTPSVFSRPRPRPPI